MVSGSYIDASKAEEGMDLESDQNMKSCGPPPSALLLSQYPPQSPKVEQLGIQLPQPVHRAPLSPSAHLTHSHSSEGSWLQQAASLVPDTRPPVTFKIQRKEVQNSLVLPAGQMASPTASLHKDPRHKSFIASVGGLTTLPSVQTDKSYSSNSVSPRQSMVDRLEAAREWARLGMTKRLSGKSKGSGESKIVNTGEGELEGDGVRRLGRSRGGSIAVGTSARRSEILSKVQEKDGLRDSAGLAAEPEDDRVPEMAEVGKERKYQSRTRGEPASAGSFPPSSLRLYSPQSTSRSGIKITRKPDPLSLISSAAEIPGTNQTPQRSTTDGTFLVSPACTEIPVLGSLEPQADEATKGRPQSPLTIGTAFHSHGQVPAIPIEQTHALNDTPVLLTAGIADDDCLVHISSQTSLRGQRIDDFEDADLSWDGPDDPDDPQNWSVRKKSFVTIIVAMYTAVIGFTSSVYLPAHEQIQMYFKVTLLSSIMGFSIYVVGLCLGILLGEPLAEVLGKKIVYGVSLPVSALFIMGSGLSADFVGVLILRFFAALFAGPVVATGTSVLADIWKLEQIAIPMAVYGFAQFSGPIGGPILGGYAVEFGGWRWTSWIPLIFSGIIYTSSYFLSETDKRKILKKRKRKKDKRRKTDELPSHMSSVSRREYQIRQQRQNAYLPSPTTTQRESIFKHSFPLLVLPLRLLALEPLITALSIYASLMSAIMIHTFLAFPYVFTRTYSFDLISSNLTLLSLLFGFFLSLCFEVLVNQSIYKTAQRRLGISFGRAAGVKLPPEERLWGMLIGATLLPISLFIFGWTAWSNGQEAIHASVPIAFGGIIMGFSIYSILSNTMLYLMETFEIQCHPSAALQSLNFLCYLIAACFPLFVLSLYQQLGNGKAASVLGALSLILGIIPWCVWGWGRVFRDYDSGDASRRSIGRRERQEGVKYGWKVRMFCEKERRRHRQQTG